MPDDRVVRDVEVALGGGAAFAAWHEQIHLWWPPTHRLAGEASSRMVFEPREGGRILERAVDGREFEWGRVQIWEPPYRIVHTWLPGGPSDTPTSVEVVFSPAGEGRTLVRVTHSTGQLGREGWDRAKVRFDHGWTALLRGFAHHTQREVPS